VHVAHFEARALARQAARPSAETRRLCVISDSGFGLVHELRQLREPKNSLIAALIGLALIRSCGSRLSLSALAEALLHRALDAHEARAELVLRELAHRAHAAVAEVVDVVDLAAAVAQVDQDLDDRDDVLVGQRREALELGRPMRRLNFMRPTADRS
jgi:hypothetical protein